MNRKVYSIILILAFCLGLAIPASAAKTVSHELLDEAVLEISNVISEETYVPWDNASNNEVTTHYTTVYYTSAPATVTILTDAWLSEPPHNLGSHFFKMTATDSYGNHTAMTGIPLAIGERIEISSKDVYAPAGSAYILDEGTYGTQTIIAYKNANGDIAYGMYWVYFIVGNSDIPPPPKTPPPPPSPPPKPETANPTQSTVYVNGEAIAFEAYNIGGANYFKLRDLAFVLNGTEKQFDVGFDNGTKAVTLSSSSKYTTGGSDIKHGDGKAKSATLTASTIYCDGEALDLVAYSIGGNNFLKLRDLMKALDVYVGYDNLTKAITLDSNWGYIG